MRVKSKWHKKSTPKSAEEIGGAIAFISWKVAANGVQRLLAEDFDMVSEERRFAVLAEFLAFLLQSADRLAYEVMDDAKRVRFVNAVAQRMADTMHENQHERLGPGDYRASFITLLNERTDGYAELGFVNGEPGYSALRYLGERVKALVDARDGKWMKEQIIDSEAPEAILYLKRSWEDLFSVELQ